MSRLETSSTPIAGAAACAPRTGLVPLPSLRVNFLWTLAGHVVYAGSQWVILVVIARLCRSEVVGRFALGLAVTAPVFLFAGLQLRASQATDAARQFRFADYLALRLAGMSVALGATGALVLASGHDPETRLVILAVGLTKAVEGVCDVYYGLMQQHEQMRPIATSLMLRGPLGVLALAAVLWAGGGLLAGVAALAASWLAVLLGHDLRAAAPLLRNAGEPHFRSPCWRDVRQIAVVSLPLGFVQMLVSLRTNIPRYFIEHHLGAAELGVFAALSSLVSVGNLVIAALGQSASPRLARLYFEGQVRSFRKLLSRLLLLAGALGGAGVLLASLAAGPLLLLLFGAEYAASADALVWLMAAGVVAYASSFLGYAVTAARSFAIQIPLFAFAALFCVGASSWLVADHGLVGAAWAWGLSLLFELVAAGVIVAALLRRQRMRA